MARILREPFVVRETGSDTSQSMANGFGRRMAQLKIGLQIKSTETIRQAVIAGMGISLLSAHTVSRELRAGGLEMLDVQGFLLMLNRFVVRRRSKRPLPVARAFKQFLLDDDAGLIIAIVPVPLTPVPAAPQARRARAAAPGGAPRR